MWGNWKRRKKFGDDKYLLVEEKKNGERKSREIFGEGNRGQDQSRGEVFGQSTFSNSSFFWPQDQESTRRCDVNFQKKGVFVTSDHQKNNHLLFWRNRGPIKGKENKHTFSNISFFWPQDQESTWRCDVNFQKRCFCDQ